MSPKSPAKPSAKPPPPWRRGAAGAYRSSDDRFEIASEGPGRWYVRDGAERDELGLERTIGPFPTLDAAKADAAARRDRPAESSPLAARLAASTAPAGRSRPSRLVRKERTPASTAPTDSGKTGPGARAVRRRTSEPRPPTWIDRLQAERPAVAGLARRRVAALERLGVEDPEAIVRRDVEAAEPAIAETLLARSIGRAVSEALEAEESDPGRHGKRVASPAAGAGERRDRVASAVVRAVLEEVSGRERDVEADVDLPGWRLVERDPADPERSRRIRVTGDDVRLGRGD